MTTYYAYDSNGNAKAYPYDPIYLQTHYSHFSEQVTYPVNGYHASMQANWQAQANPVGYYPEYAPLVNPHFQYHGGYTSTSVPEMYHGPEHGYYYGDAQYLGSLPDEENPVQRLHEYHYLDTIRRHHNMYTLLPHIRPRLKIDALGGRIIDIVEVDTDNVLIRSIPKNLLSLFCGHKIHRRYLMTKKRDGDDYNVDQVFRVPQGKLNHEGLLIWVTWMRRACSGNTMNDMRPIKVPGNLFAAISLARVFSFFGLHKDEARVDKVIRIKHFRRPIFPDELKTIWTKLPKDSKYTFQVCSILSVRIQNYEMTKSNKALRKADEILEYLEQEPELNERIRNSDVNEACRTVSNSNWCENLIPEMGENTPAEEDAPAEDAPAEEDSNAEDPPEETTKTSEGPPSEDGSSNNKISYKSRIDNKKSEDAPQEETLNRKFGVLQIVPGG